MSQDLFNPNDTLFRYPWPKGLNGIERVACSSMGDLQRMLSSYFNVPITVKRVYVSQTPDPRPTPSAEAPIVQHRRVHLLTSPFSLQPDASTTAGQEEKVPQKRIVCVATSIVRISSEIAAQKFLDEKYAIGQVFRILGRVADFHLLEVTTGLGNETTGKPGREYLRRKYLLKTEGFECEIEEVFQDRAMFTTAMEDWIVTPEDRLDIDLK